MQKKLFLEAPFQGRDWDEDRRDYRVTESINLDIVPGTFVTEEEFHEFIEREDIDVICRSKKKFHRPNNQRGGFRGHGGRRDW